MKALILVLFISSNCLAEDFYLNSSGNKVQAQDAIVSSAKGDTVYKCTQQEFKVSKSGTSIGVKNKKKKLTKEQIADQIKDLQKRGE